MRPKAAAKISPKTKRPMSSSKTSFISVTLRMKKPMTTSLTSPVIASLLDARGSKPETVREAEL